MEPDPDPRGVRQGGAEAGTQPVGHGDYVVKPGDCLASIAREHGYSWKTLWEHPENADLRRARKDPSVLFPGDRVYVPAKQRGLEPCNTETRRRFRVKQGETRLRLRIRKRETQIAVNQLICVRTGIDPEPEASAAIAPGSSEPRANERYTLEVGGSLLEGRTDSQGRVDVKIKGDEKRAHLTVGDDEDRDEFELHIGELDPIDSIRGVQQRLNNLGFSAGPADDIYGPKTGHAIRLFQSDMELEVTSRPDEATRRSLQGEHGS